MGPDDESLPLAGRDAASKSGGGDALVSDDLSVRFNRRHRLSGHLFQGRYKAVVVNPEEEGYYPRYVMRTGRPEWFKAGRVLGNAPLLEETFRSAKLRSTW